MSAAVAGRVQRPSGPGFPDGFGRWASCLALVLAVHLGAAAFVLAPGRDLAEGAPSDAINIDLLPDASDKAEKPDEVAGPEVVESQAPTSMAAADDAEPPAPDSPPPTEVERMLKAAAPELTAPTTAAEAAAVPARPVDEPRAEATADPAPQETISDAEKAAEERRTVLSRASTGNAGLLGGGRRPSAAAEASWRGEIGQHLVKYRRFPSDARNGGQQGTARVRVTIDGDGHVLGRDLLKSSGHPLLDREALDMMTRSDPFPKPPPGMPSPVVLNVPVNFAIR